MRGITLEIDTRQFEIQMLEQRLEILLEAIRKTRDADERNSYIIESQEVSAELERRLKNYYGI